jgi:rhodanese-related sulfurtransferase
VEAAVSLEIRPEELQQRLQAGEPIYLLDVRQEWEHQTARLQDNQLIPLHELPARLDEVQPAPGQLVVAYCHHGVRSLGAAAFLRDNGFEGALSLAGGIDLWSQVVDPSVPRY